MDDLLVPAVVETSFIQVVRNEAQVTGKACPDFRGQVVHVIHFQFHVVHMLQVLLRHAFPPQEFMEAQRYPCPFPRPVYHHADHRVHRPAGFQLRPVCSSLVGRFPQDLPPLQGCLIGYEELQLYLSLFRQVCAYILKLTVYPVLSPVKAFCRRGTDFLRTQTFSAAAY